MRFSFSSIAVIAMIAASSLVSFLAEAQVIRDPSAPIPANSVGVIGKIEPIVVVQPTLYTCANGLLSATPGANGCRKESVCGITTLRIFIEAAGKIGSRQTNYVTSCDGVQTVIEMSKTSPDPMKQVFVEVPNISGFYSIYFWPVCPSDTLPIIMSSSRSYRDINSFKEMPMHEFSQPSANTQEMVTISFACASNY